ncbi:MAG TPA: hypothetical protein VI451_01160 [Anaerolineales bacterium]|nr:hypothetical protein [Anaerolineales bacterium]
MLNKEQWKTFNPSKVEGKLCYHYCSRQSVLPIRDVLNDHYKGKKTEPNYETATYNWCGKCNQLSINAAVNDNLSHILFATKYCGCKKEFKDRYFIVGYYEIGWTTKVGKRTAIRAKNMCFVPVERAYEITAERWRRINPKSQTPRLKNLRQATQRISGSLLDEIIGHLDQGNAVDDFLHEVALLKAEYNPFDSVPKGRIFIINVGANTTNSLQSPLFENATFEFVPIPEYQPIDNFAKIRTFADLKQFNASEKPLMDLFPQLSKQANIQAHNDPEFITLTYGDNVVQKSNLQDLQKGDYLFFLARLVPYRTGKFHHNEAIFALVGYFEVDECNDDPNSSLFISPAFLRNAHVKRWLVNPSSFTNFVVFKGSTNSRRFRFAVPFNRELIEHVPFLKADGSFWDWGRTTELGIIGANTRTVRMYIDPNSKNGQERVERFWQFIFDTQKWSKNSAKKHCRPC